MKRLGKTFFVVSLVFHEPEQTDIDASWSVRCYDGDVIYLWDCTLGELSYFRVQNTRSWVAKLSNWGIIVSVKQFTLTYNKFLFHSN